MIGKYLSKRVVISAAGSVFGLGLLLAAAPAEAAPRIVVRPNYRANDFDRDGIPNRYDRNDLRYNRYGNGSSYGYSPYSYGNRQYGYGYSPYGLGSRRDPDGDGIRNKFDPDNDNDGVRDRRDDAPKNPWRR